MAHSASLKRGCHRDVLDCVRDAFAEASGENALTSSVQDDWQEFIADEGIGNSFGSSLISLLSNSLGPQLPITSMFLQTPTT